MKKVLVIGCLLGLCGASVALAHEGGKHGGRFAKLDADGDGKVTLVEMQKMTQERFTKLDANHDGVLVADEMHHGRGHCNGEHGRGQGKPDAKGAAGTGATR